MQLIVNGTERIIEADSGRTLLEVLREDLRLTGTKYGCGEGECGACTVLVDGVPTRSCTVDIAAVRGAVTTIEGLALDGRLHPVQAAFVEERALQCGYCTPGMVMSATALLADDPEPDDTTIRDRLAGHVCRCGGYPRIVLAVRRAATQPDATVDIVAEPPVAEPPVAEPTADRSVWTVVLPPGDAGGPGRGSAWGWSTPGGAWLAIDPDGRITAYTGKVEGGQGNRASLTRMVAAELGATTAMVRLEMGDTSRTPFDYGTVGSRSTPDAGHGLRLVAAGARRALLEEAARRWEISADDLVTGAGLVRVPGGGPEISFGELVSAGPREITVDRDEPLPTAQPGLSDVDDVLLRRYLGTAVTGAKRFPSDLTLPGLRHGRILRPPAYGATLRALEASAARDLPDVTVVADGGFVGVVAPTPAAATAALELLQAEWDVAEQPADTDLEWHLREHPLDIQGWGGAVSREAGEVDTAMAGADVRLTATYTAAYLAHVPMEPRVALAQVAGENATVWAGTQRPFAVRGDVAAALGLDPERVRVIVPDFGGGFGGKHSSDVAVEAARLAKAAGVPVKVSWTREEEFRWAYFRPAAVIDVRSGATRDGSLTGWEFTNINSGAAGLFTPYQVANRRERFQPADSPLAQGSYRALAATVNTFARESHMDELALALGIDAVKLRLDLLRDDRLRDVLAALAERIGWPGPGWGVACEVEKDCRVATAAEVRVDPDGRLHVRRIVTAVEAGAVVDPTGLRNQIIGATVMGLGGALYEGIRFSRGRVGNASLASYRVPRFGDIPPIDVMILDRPDLPSAGAGETPIVAIAPAIANAVHAVTGKRLRALPLTPEGTVP